MSDFGYHAPVSSAALASVSADLLVAAAPPSPPMLFLHVIPSMDPLAGGVSQAVRTLVKGLASQNIESEIVCLDSPEVEHVNNLDASVSALGPGHGPWSFSKRLSPWLRSNIKRFDVVIVHGLWLYQSFAVRRFFSKIGEVRCRPSWYVMPHGMLDPYFQRDPSRRLKAIRNSAYWRVAEKAVINQSDGVLFTCSEEMRLARVPFPGYSPVSEKVVGLGVEEPPVFLESMDREFKKSCPGLGNRPYILFLSRIHPKKGLDLAIEAYVVESSTRRSKADPIPALVIAGPLDSAYAREMLEMVAKLTLQNDVGDLSDESRPSIVFTGMLAGEAKWGAFHGCNAFLLPSHQENFGIAVVEALACSKPVLISNEINIWREIEEAGAGFAAEDDMSGTCGNIRRWLSMSSEEKIEMGRKARACFLDNFQVDVAAKCLVNAIADFQGTPARRSTKSKKKLPIVS